MSVPDDIALFILVGFVAQMVDGALGMAYGVTSTTFLIGFGVPPAVASASVHTAEVVTTGVSGLSHWRFGNVDGPLMRRLVIPGVIGSVLGAYILTQAPVALIKPVVSAYLVVMGIVILAKAVSRVSDRPVRTKLVPLGLAGGFLDAMGGGGWGPIVTSTLIARGNTPRYTIGSVNMAEFFVTVASSVTFVLTIGLSHWRAILGLMVGGVIAAPFGAYVCRLLPARFIMFMVGVLVTFLSLRTLVQTLF